MNLRPKIFLSLVILFAAYVFADYSIQDRIVYASFVELEETEAAKDIDRCVEALLREIEHLSLLCFDWSAWDDSYEYAVDRNEEYEESNFTETTFTDTDLNVVFVVDNDGAVIWGEIYEIDDEGELLPLELEGFPRDAFPASHRLLRHETIESGISGLLMTEHGPMLVASRPILDSNSEGPIRGSLVMGRFLTEDRVEMLVEQTRVDFSTWPVQGAMPADCEAALSRMSPDRTTLIEEAGEDALSVFTVFNDLDDRPALLMHADVPRDISARGTAAMRATMASLIGAGLAMLIALLSLLQGLVVGPVSKLTAHTVEIGASGKMTKPIEMKRSDEIGTLATEFNRMMQQLEEARERFVDASRRAGMAEVASGVLHNVGNALNSVTVSTSVIRDSVHKSKLGGLPKAVGLMREHADDLGSFITEDERGRRLPGYLEQLAEVQENEQESLITEVDHLKESIEHIKDIVNVQQSFAGSTIVSEPLSVVKLLENALTVTHASFARDEITVAREWSKDLPEIDVDRSKFVQLIVNLMMNAKDALIELEPPGRTMTVRVEPAGAGQVRIEISDRGKGIEAENLGRIFSRGFTTKKDGHGFGLHYCEQIVKDFGGSLSAHSDGPGQGASFVIELPTESAGRRAAA